MNGENVDDLAVGPGELDLHFGKKEEGVTEPADRTLAPPAGAGANFGFVLAHGDVTGDGHAELVEAAQGPSGQPTGTFASRSAARAGRATSSGSRRGCVRGPTSLAIGDVDGDRYGDLVAGVPRSSDASGTR